MASTYQGTIENLCWDLRNESYRGHRTRVVQKHAADVIEQLLKELQLKDPTT
jgi:hypothetical protein